MTFKFLHRFQPAAPRGSARPPRAASEKRVEPDRPVRVYSLLLPPTFPRDRR
jgi:hypothetical protein